MVHPAAIMRIRLPIKAFRKRNFEGIRIIWFDLHVIFLYYIIVEVILSLPMKEVLTIFILNGI